METRWKQTIIATSIVFTLFVLQHYFRRFGMPIEEIYFTILFDSVALTGVVLIGLSYLLGPLAILWPDKWTPKLPLRKQLGLTGFGFILLHVILVLPIFNPEYYPKMFIESGKLSTLGEISLLAGAIALVIFGIVASTSIHSTKAAMKERTWVAVQRLGLLALVLSIFHFAILKWKGWFVWENWHNGIPSGTLVVTTFVIIVFLFRGIARWKKIRAEK